MAKLTARGRDFETVHMIRNPDGNAGFCALMTYALNEVRLALGNDWLPVVNYDRESCWLFHDPERGENVWEYYFEPVYEVSYAQVADLLARGGLDPTEIHSYDPRRVMEWHHTDPDRLATFWATDVPEDPAAWIAAKRELGRRYVGDFIRVKPYITAKVDDFVERRMKGHYVFGAHVRGTDFAYAEPTAPEDYMRAIERLANEKGLPDFRVFLATDQQQFVDLFGSEYGERLLTYDALRSSDDTAPFRLAVQSPYKKGEDVLIDTLLMSRSDHLLKCAAAGGEYALWFNPTLECTDFALGSSFDERNYHRLKSAYLKLNVDDMNPMSLAIRRWYTVCVQYVRQKGWLVLPKRALRALRRLRDGTVRSGAGHD
jgi:hypothetical protein